MKTLTWEEYRKNFWKWTWDEQGENLQLLTSLGEPEDVAKIIFKLKHLAFRNQLLEMANNEKLEFSGKTIYKLFFKCSADLVNVALCHAAYNVTEKELRDIAIYANRELIKAICKRREFIVPAVVYKYPVPPEAKSIFDASDHPQKKSSLLGNIVGGLILSDIIDDVFFDDDDKK